MKEIRKTPLDGDSETQIPETCLQPSRSNLVDFLDELQKLVRDAFGIAAHAIIEQFLYAKLPPHLKKIKTSGQPGEWHKKTDCHPPRKQIRDERFGSP